MGENGSTINYGGHTMRSHLEAKTGHLLDQLQTNWKYEPTRFDFKNTPSYLPDFQLNEKQFIETKGQLRKDDLTKIRSLVLEKQKELIYITQNQVKYFTEIEDELESCPAHIIKCSNCSQLGFVPSLYNWNCRNCGENNGDQDIVKTRILEHNTDSISTFQSIRDFVNDLEADQDSFIQKVNSH